MKKTLATIALLALTGCGGNAPSQSSASPIASLSPVPTPAEVKVPDAEPCHRKHISVKKDTFEQCLPIGLSYVDAANMIGTQGELQAQSGNSEIYQWNDGAGKYLTATFIDGKLASKSQVGLEMP